MRPRRVLSVLFVELACLTIVSPVARALDAPRLAFVSSRDGGPDIYTVTTRGTDIRRLTTTPGVDQDPAFSPDGTKIAFTSYRDGNPEIYVMNADGSEPTRLTFDPRADVEPSWSPTGKRIAFSTESGSTSGTYRVQIASMRADGSDVRLLTSGVGFAFSPAFSPDGRLVAYTLLSGGQADVWVMGPGGGGPRNLSASGADDTHPTWAPSGERLAFASNRGSSPASPLSRIFTMWLDGSHQRPLTAGAVDAEPAWAPGGTWIAFVRDEAGPTLWRVRRDGSGPSPIGDPALPGTSPAWGRAATAPPPAI